MTPPIWRHENMEKEDKKTSVRGIGLALSLVMGKANGLPSSIRNHGILGTPGIIMRTFFQYFGVVKQ